MRKIKNITIGGIQQKIINLIIITIVMIVAVFATVIFYQSGRLTTLVRDTIDSQKESISSISEETMDAVLDTNLTQSTQMQAYIAKGIFGDAVRTVKIVADYTGKLFADPESYPAREVNLPDPAKDGQISVQVLTKEGIDLSEPTVSSKLGLIGNLSDLLVALYADSNIDSCYCALPEGVMLLVDNHSKSKFDENDEIIPIPIHDRLWYKGAVETGKLYYTDVTTDLFTGKTSIMCSLPIYQNDELVAVIGADLFLDDISAAVNSTARNGSFICVVNQNGHVLFSPQDSGIFQALPADKAPDLRAVENQQLATFISDSLSRNTDLKLIEADGELCYVVGAPIQNVGWAVISVVPKSLADLPANTMLNQFNTIQSEATETFYKGVDNTRTIILVFIAIIVVLAVTAAILLSKRIVKPLEAITNRVLSLGGNDLQFQMEDIYRTHDEIELLAESFAMLSSKTLAYIAMVEHVTAEKERIGTELSLATRIQADMLPNIYPAFPDRPEFDIYATMNPAKEVGGDFYDFFLVDDDHLCMIMADVSGKGVPAALFMMASRIILANNATMGKSPAQILHDTNTAICANNREEMFVTVWLGILEISTGKLTAANAGHEYPALKLPNGDFELFKDKHGFVIGGISGKKYTDYEFTLDIGGTLFVYTDGVPEATDTVNNAYGTDRMLDALNSSTDDPPRGAIDSVYEDLRALQATRTSSTTSPCCASVENEFICVIIGTALVLFCVS